MTGHGSVADDPPPGAQAERTRLSWTRTSAAVMVGSVVALRVTVGELGPLAVVLAAVCAVVAAFVLGASHWRYRRAADAMSARAHLPDGRLPALFGGVIVALGVLVIVYSAAA